MAKNISYGNATYKDVKPEDSAAKFYRIQYFEQSVKDSNFYSSEVIDFINDFYG